MLEYFRVETYVKITRWHSQTTIKLIATVGTYLQVFEAVTNFGHFHANYVGVMSLLIICYYLPRICVNIRF